MKLLAFDTSTQTMGIALHLHNQTHTLEAPGGAQASEQLLAQIHNLLSKFKLRLNELDAIAFGCGPGAFTGLRASCAVAQGLGMGAQRPLIPIVTLQAAAQEHIINMQQQTATPLAATNILVQLDARMDEWYWAHYAWEQTNWRVIAPPALSTPEELHTYINQHNPQHIVNMTTVQMHGMIKLAQQAWEKGETITPEHALPLYLRNKVALTTAERALLHQEKQNASLKSTKDNA